MKKRTTQNLLNLNALIICVVYFFPLFESFLSSTLYWATYIGLIAVLGGGVLILVVKNYPAFNFNFIDGCLLLFLVMMAAMILGGQYVNEYGYEKLLKVSLSVVVFGLVTARMQVSTIFQTRFYTTLAICSLIISTLVLFSSPLYSGRNNILDSNPIWVARYSGYVCLIFGIYHIFNSNFIPKSGRYLGFIIGIGAIFSTGSVGPFFSVFVSLGLIQVIRINVKAALSLVMLVLVIIVILQFFAGDVFYNNEVYERFSRSSMIERLVEGSRAQFYDTALFLGNSNLFGVGVGGFSEYERLNYPHNIFLEIYSELGIFALLIFSWLVSRTLMLSMYRVSVGGVFDALVCCLFLYSLINAFFSGDASSLKMFYFAMIGVFISSNVRRAEKRSKAKLRKRNVYN